MSAWLERILGRPVAVVATGVVYYLVIMAILYFSNAAQAPFRYGQF